MICGGGGLTYRGGGIGLEDIPGQEGGFMELNSKHFTDAFLAARNFLSSLSPQS